MAEKKIRTALADIHQINCSFNGDKETMDSRFEMIYSNLAAHAWNDSSGPLKIVAQNSGIVNQTPPSPGKPPRWWSTRLNVM